MVTKLADHNPQLRDIHAHRQPYARRTDGIKLELESGASFDIYRTSLSTTLGFGDGSLGLLLLMRRSR